MKQGIEVYPVKFEAYEAGCDLFTVETFDTHTATVSISAGVNHKDWPAISDKIMECLIAMKLEE